MFSTSAGIPNSFPRQTTTSMHVMDVHAPLEHDRVYLNVLPRSSAGAFGQTANICTLSGMYVSQTIVEFNISKIKN
jgi:hypothetical protein